MGNSPSNSSNCCSIRFGDVASDQDFISRLTISVQFFELLLNCLLSEFSGEFLQLPACLSVVDFDLNLHFITSSVLNLH